MRSLISLRMEVHPFRVIAMLFAIPIVAAGIICLGGFVFGMLGYDLTPAEKKWFNVKRGAPHRNVFSR